jgi:hypothetical protein
VAVAPVPDSSCVEEHTIVLAHTLSEVEVGATDWYCMLATQEVRVAHLRSPSEVRPDVYWVDESQTVNAEQLLSVVLVGSTDSYSVDISHPTVKVLHCV